MQLNRYIVLGLFASLAACSGGSGVGGVGVENNVDTTGNETPVFVYDGPQPQTEDVQQYKLEFWDNLVESDRCGACHNESQNPRFLRADDVNLAYAETNTLIDRQTPSNSALVTKVNGGHNCWLDVATVCGDIITGYIEAWVQQSGGSANEVVLTAPAIHEVGSRKAFPADSADYAPVHNLLTQYCSSCHSEESARQQPFIASADIDIAYDAAQSRIDLALPANSRLVARLRSEFHNCWSDCGANANELETAIANFSNTIPETEVPADLVISKALNLARDGIVASSGGRVENDLIALYEFKAGTGGTAFDTSGVEPSAHLNLIGDVEWLGSFGIRLIDGKAQASTASSEKLHNLITATGEYSIEAWLVPDNVSQDGPARIVSYAGGDSERNFMLGQTLYNYDFLHRSSATDGNGMPALSTDDDAEFLQATLQHVVVSYSPVDGKRIYVNGEFTGAADQSTIGSLNDWDDSFALAVGNEVSNNAQWQGSVRLLAIYNRAMSEAAISANFEAGVGQKFFLLFSVAHITNVADSYVVFEVQQFDDYSYLFNAPFFTQLGSSQSFSGFDLRGIRIGINGKEAAVGQSFANIQTTISADTMTAGRQTLSTLGAVIALDQGPEDDEFFISFDQLAGQDSVRVAAEPISTEASADIPDQSRIGLRRFAEINYSLAAITGVDVANSAVAETYNRVRQQLPLVEAVDGFLSAHQMGVTQLAVEYCNAAIDGASTRTALFPSFDFSQTPDLAFDANGRAALIVPLLQRTLSANLPSFESDNFHPGSQVLADQPIEGAVNDELNDLIDLMQSACSGSCPSQADRTETIAKAVCAATVGSAVMLLQ